MGKLIDRLPIWVAVLLGIAMGLAPFYPQPHLLQKLTMLIDGTLSRPLDIFDLFWHGFFPVLLVIKLVRVYQLRAKR